MTLTVPPKRYALLVGIDLYLNDGARTNKNKDTIAIRNLQGCVNDVQAIKEFLQREFQVHQPRVLTSPPLSDIWPSILPTESPDLRPTFDNIKREFDQVFEQASAGDLFFFHYSGHGALLQPTSKSPPGRLRDPSLITMDFCNGKPAVRGWQLNEWLKRLNEKKIRIIVILDSCHAGGGWRTSAHSRTPQGWTDVNNNSMDEEAIKETVSESVCRDGELTMSWAINPDGFTLMAACESHEQAMETSINGKPHGAFTYELLACFQPNPRISAVTTYRNLRDQVAERLVQQTPRVFGRDRLLFFGHKEPFSVTPLVARIEKDTILIPTGKYHGVQKGLEFMTHHGSNVAFSVNRVNEFECRAPILSEHVEIFKNSGCQVIPSRWSLGDSALRVLVHGDLGSEFRQNLHEALQDRVIGMIEITESNYTDVLTALMFRLTKLEHNGAEILGPSSLIGYEDPVRGIHLTGIDSTQLASKCAIAIVHLTRFSQVVALRNLSAEQQLPFAVNLQPEGNTSSSPTEPKKFTFEIRNESESRVYFTVIVLGPGFHIRQLYPSHDSAVSLDRGQTSSFSFNMTTPDELKGYSENRNIIRTIVTNGRPQSWKSVELPHIWNAGQMEAKRDHNSQGRDAVLLNDTCVWIQDEIIYTVKADH